MKKFVKVALAAGAVAMFAAPAPAGTQIVGQFVLDISGFIKNVPATPMVSCSAVAFLVPDTSANPTVSQLAAAVLLNSGGSASGGISATVAANKQNFTCQVTVPYSFNNYNTGQQVIVVFKVSGQDAGTTTNGVYIPGVPIGSTRQVIQVPSIPANGAATYLGQKIVFI